MTDKANDFVELSDSTLESGNLNSDEKITVDDTAPLMDSNQKGFVARHKRAFIGISVVVVIIVLSLFDIWYGLMNKSNLSVDSAEVSFDSTANADATVTINGNMATRSYMHSLAVDDSRCTLQYSVDGQSTTMQDLGKIHGSVSNGPNNKFAMTLALQDVSFSPLRHLLSNSYWNSPTGAAIQCHAGVTLYVYYLIPFRLSADVEASVLSPSPGITKIHYASSGISGTNVFKFSTDVEIDRQAANGDQIEVKHIVRSMKKWMDPFQRWVNRHLKTVLIESQSVSINTEVANPIDPASLPLSSVVVKVPQISFAISLLGLQQGLGRYHFSSSAFQLQLANPTLNFDLDLSLLCSDAFDPANPVTQLRPCAMLDIENSKALLDTLLSGRVDIAIDSATNKNFIAQLMGTHHTLAAQTVDMAVVEARLQSLLDNDASSSSTATALVSTAAQANGIFAPTKDPRISTGGKCITGTADNVYDTYTCSVVEKGFFEFYLYVFDEDGLMSKIQLLTSWAPSPPFASASEVVVVARGGYEGGWNSTISELYQNATLSVRYSESQDIKLVSRAVAQWDLKDPAQEGSVSFIGFLDSDFSGPERFDISTMLEYGDNAYSTSFFAKYNFTDSSVLAGRAYALGTYGGNLNNWYLGLNDSAVFYNGMKQGDAQGLASSDVSSSGDRADINLYLQARDGNEVEQFYTKDHVQWSSDETWLQSGSIAASGIIRIINTLDADAAGALNYADHAYNFFVSETTSDLSPVFATSGNGKYGGNWNDWYATLLQSSVYSYGKLFGAATGAISSYVTSSGDAALLTFATQATDGSGVEQLYTANNASWSSPTGWVSAGQLSANSAFRLINTVDLVAHGDLSYADHAYDFHVSDMTGDLSPVFSALGNGKYGGNWNDWYASLLQSSVYWYDKLYGAATGVVSSQMTSSGDAALLTLATQATDGNGIEQLYTVNNASWSSPSNWLSAGQLYANSAFRLINTVDLVAHGDLSYADHAYDFHVSDLTGDLSPVFSALGNGKYGGSWNDWYASLLQSSVYWYGDLFGAATGAISSYVTSTGDAALFTLFTQATDGNGVEQLYTANNASWSSPASWFSSGQLYANSAFRLINTIDLAARGDLNYADDAYTFGVFEASTPGNSYAGVGNGKYGGSWTNWWGTLERFAITINDIYQGYVSGSVSAEVATTGEDALIAATFQGRNEYENLVLDTEDSVQWSTQDSWLLDGSVQAKSYFNMKDVATWNTLGAFVYGDHSYSISAKDLSGASNPPIFELYGAGGYGGSWNDWWASLTNSYLFFSGTKFGNIVGAISSAITPSGDIAAFSFFTQVNDGNEVEQLYTNDKLAWTTDSSWTQTGNITVGSVFRLINSVNWNAQGALAYGDHAYSVLAAEYTLTNAKQFLASGSGFYGGSIDAFWASLTQSALYLNDAFVGSAVGYFSSTVESTNTGEIILTAQAFDSNAVQQLESNNSISWMSPSLNWADTGNITLSSTVATPTSVNWRALGDFTFDQGTYTVLISEEGYYSGASQFLTTGAGTYGGTFGNWHVGVSESVCYISDVKQGSASGELRWLQVYDFTTVQLAASAIVKDGQDKPIIDTTNLVTWLYTKPFADEPTDAVSSTLYTSTAMYGAPNTFMLFSKLDIDFSNETASFEALQLQDNMMGLNATATAFYDLEFGMLTGINTAVSYQNDLLFQAHTFWGAQLETADLSPTQRPTAVPTTAPSAAPTGTNKPTTMPTVPPTVAPTTAAPSAEPSAAPTVAHTWSPTVMPTFVPSAVPTVSPQPTVSPSARPTAVPSFAPTKSPVPLPTAEPTFMPSASPTAQSSPILTFSSNVTLAGVSQPGSLDQASQNAMVNVTATLMGLQSNAVTYKGTYTVNTGARRFLKGHASLFATTYSVICNMVVSAPLSATTYTSTTEMYNGLTTQLDTAVTTGAFTTQLRRVSVLFNATEIESAGATTVSNGEPEVAGVPSSGGDNGLGAGPIAGIVIGVLAFVGIAAAAGYYYYSTTQGGSSAAAAAQAAPTMTTPVNAGAKGSSASSSAPPAPPTSPSTTWGSASPGKGGPKSPTSSFHSGGDDQVFGTENPLAKMRASNQRTQKDDEML